MPLLKDPMKEKVLSAALIVIISLKCMDLLVDVNQNVEFSHVLQEIALICVSLLLFISVIYDIFKKKKALTTLKVDLKEAKDRQFQISAELKKSKKDFWQAVMQQFETWQLSPKETEVATFLLKGLSLNEIAALREASEKTIRHQASAVYAKSGCSGRHELAAYFFETLYE